MDITDIISYLASSETMPKINNESNCELAFKLMNENNLDKILVEDDNKKIIGVIDETNLLKAVLEKSFKEKIKKFVINKIKKVNYDLELEKLISIFKKEKLVFVYKKSKFVGMITRNDLLCYLKRNINAKK